MDERHGSIQEGDATTELGAPAPERVHEGQTVELSQGRPRSLFRPLRNRFVRGGWTGFSAAAGFSFLVLVALGAVLVSAVKLQYPAVGAGSDPVAVLSALVIVGLGALRVPVHIGDLTASALPLGALALILWAVSWSAERVVRSQSRVHEDRRAAMLEGAKIALPFAVMCWGAALVFRIRAEPDPVFAGAIGALLLGGLWAFIGGALGGLRATGSLRSHFAVASHHLRERRPALWYGARTAAVMLGGTGLGAAAATLLWVVLGLIGGGPRGDFGFPTAVAGFIYFLAFLPNVVTAVASIALGAPIEIGAQVAANGGLVGPLREFSLSEWGGEPTPALAYLLILIPLVSCVGAWFIAGRHSIAKKSHVIGWAAVLYAGAAFELAALAEARLGAGLVRARGLARVAPQAGQVLILALLFAFIGGVVGWEIARSRRQRDAANPAS